MSGSRPNLSTMLDELMRARGVSLDQLSLLSGVNRSTIYRWRGGRVGRAYGLANVLRIAKALELDRIATSQLLQAAGHATLDRLTPSPDDVAVQELLEHWEASMLVSLPADLTSFIGRDDELMGVADLLHRQGVRLVTLTGPGGCGKTRLARRVAGELQDGFSGGVLFVPLASVDEPAAVLPTLARRAGLREASGVGVAEQLAGHLGRKRILLVLDNFEQVIDAGRDVVELLQAATGASALVTSRIPLHVRGETAYPVAPFPIPPESTPIGELSANPAIELFLARARAADATREIHDNELPAVRRMCEMLDGIPLAIELAAARSGQYPISELLDLFPTGLSLAEDGPRDADARQQTLRAAIAWSWELLDPQERRLVTRLGVFAGDWYGDAAEQICRLPGEGDAALAPGLIDQLVYANLVQRLDDAGHYGFLQTIREYAVEQLDAGLECEILGERHARFFLELAEERSYIYVPGMRRSGNLEWIDQNYRNIRAAMEWSFGNDRAMLVRFAAALWPYWHEFGAFREGRTWIEEALRSGVELPPRTEAELQTGLLMLAYSDADHQTAWTAGDAALELWNDLDDEYGKAVTLLYLGQTYFIISEIEAAAMSFIKSIANWQNLDHQPGLARCLNEIGVLWATTGAFDQAVETLERARAIYKREGLTEGVARCLIDQGLAITMAGKPWEAISILEQGVEIARELRNNTIISFGLFYLGASFVFMEQLEAARPHLEESLRRRYEARDRYGAAYTMLGFSALGSRERNPESARRAARVAGAAVELLDGVGIVMNPGMQAIYDQEMDGLRDQLGDEFEIEFEEGRQLLFGRAVAEALGG